MMKVADVNTVHEHSCRLNIITKLQYVDLQYKKYILSNLHTILYLIIPGVGDSVQNLIEYAQETST